MSLRKLFLLSSVFALFTLTAFSQVDTGAIVGTVNDNQQHIIAGADIVLREVSTGAERITKSGRDGSFSFSPLSIGDIP